MEQAFSTLKHLSQKKTYILDNYKSTAQTLVTEDPPNRFTLHLPCFHFTPGNESTYLIFISGNEVTN